MNTAIRVVGFLLIGVLAVVKWVLRLTLAVVETLGAFVGDTLIDDTQPKSTRQPKEKKDKPEKDAQVVTMKSFTVPKGKKAELLASGWTVVQDIKKDGMAILSHEDGREMLVNTRTWDPISEDLAANE